MRKKHREKRVYSPDVIYGKPEFSRFINYLMKDGKKSVAEKIFYKALELVKEKTKKDPVEIFEEAIKNASPLVEVRSRRIGGANYQIPVEVRGDRRFALACRWIIQAMRNRRGKPAYEKLAEELILASQGEGMAVKKKNEVHRIAEANKAFAHFAW